jgi:hypothetical protein
MPDLLKHRKRILFFLLAAIVVVAAAFVVPRIEAAYLETRGMPEIAGAKIFHFQRDTEAYDYGEGSRSKYASPPAEENESSDSNE